MISENHPSSFLSSSLSMLCNNQSDTLLLLGVLCFLLRWFYNENSYSQPYLTTLNEYLCLCVYILYLVHGKFWHLASGMGCSFLLPLFENKVDTILPCSCCLGQVGSAKARDYTISLSWSSLPRVLSISALTWWYWTVGFFLGTRELGTIPVLPPRWKWSQADITVSPSLHLRTVLMALSLNKAVAFNINISYAHSWSVC